MEDLTTFITRLENGEDLNLIRCEIADLITHQLQRSRATSHVAALMHLTNAVGSLTLNVNSTRQPTMAGLQVCLMDLEKAIAALDAKSKNYELRGKRAEAITYDLLIEAVRAIRDKASCDASSGSRAA